MAEFTKVTSSSTQPSSTNFTSARGACSPAISVGGGEGSCVGRDACSREEDGSEEEPLSSEGAGPATTATAAAPFSAPPSAVLRFPLRHFLFLHPRSV